MADFEGSPSQERREFSLEDLSIEELMAAREIVTQMATDMAIEMHTEGLPSQDPRLESDDADTIDALALERRLRAVLQVDNMESIRKRALEIDELIARRVPIATPEYD